MKREEFYKKSITILLLAIVLMGCILWEGVFSRNLSKEASTTASAQESATLPATTSGIRGAWVSFGDYKGAGLYNKSEEEFTKNADKYFKKLKKDGINTLYFHAVPCNDAIYPSKYLSWTHYMFESAPDYDPMEILIDTAHKHDLTFHAWLNPYRKKVGVIFNPGKASSQKRIVRIVKEIIENYEVDGIHFDDYFYPAKSKGQQFHKVPIKKRKKVINAMVKKVYQTVKKQDENLLFGISPAGNIEYAESLGCDLDSWLSEDGYMDYIVPQIYWSDQYRVGRKTVTMYSNRLNKWTNLNQNDMPMFIGLALYRAGSYDSSDLGWYRKSNNLVTQIKKLNKKGCEGYVLFSSTYLYKKETKKEVKKYRNYIRNLENL